MRIINRLKYYLTLFFWTLIERPRLKKFKNKHQGEDCFIIGNGPSLNKMDLLKLNDYHTFGMNKIYMIFKRVNLNLSYLAAVNNLVIEQSKAEYESMDMPIFVAHNKSKGVIKKRHNVFRLFTKGGQSWSFDSLEEPIFEGMTVTYVALQMAHYMGFKRVFLVGVDHNFVQSGNPHEKQTMKGADLNHFDPNYFAGNEWHLADLKGSEVSYQMADYAFCKTGGKVFDATVDGKLQVFEKIDLEKAFEIAKEEIMSENSRENIAIFSLNPDLIDGYGHYLHYDLKIKNHLSSQISDFYIFGHKTFQQSDNQNFIIPTFAKKTYDDVPLLTYSDLEKYKEGLRKAFAIIDKTVADKKVVYQYMGSVWHAWALAEIIQGRPLKNTTFKINIFHDRARLLAGNFRQSSYFAEYDFILKELTKSPLQLYTDTYESQATFEQYFAIKLPYFPMFSVSDFGEIKEKVVADKPQFCYPGNVQKAKGFDVLVNALNQTDLDAGHFKIRTFISYLQKELQAWINDLPKHPNVEIIGGSLSTDEYSKLLQDADVILLPYRAADFGGRTSGIYADAVILEKPVVITRETWGGTYTEKYENGIGFSDGNVEEMQNAIQQIIKEYPQRKQAAIEAKKQWLEENGIAAFCKELLNQTALNQSFTKKMSSLKLKQILSKHRPSGLALLLQRARSSNLAMQMKKTWIEFYHKI